MQRADKQVLAQLRASQTALNAHLKALAARPGFSNAIREAQLRLAKREIQLEMARLFRKLGDITSAMRLEAAARVLDVNRQLDAFKLLGAGLPDGAEVAQAIADAELDAARSGIDRMTARLQGASYNSLSQRVYTATSGLNGPISTLVNNALAAGLSAREFANAAKDFINPLTPGGVRYASYRLARTEINNAAHAVAVDAVQDKPWVSGMKWHLSGSHPRVDICNSLASGGPKNDGVYAKTSVPSKPHPQCFCYVTPETDDEEEFLDNLISGHYDEYLDKYRNLKSGEILRSNVSIPHPPATPAAKTLPGARAGTSRGTPPATRLKPNPAPKRSFAEMLEKASARTPEEGLDAAKLSMLHRSGGRTSLLKDDEIRAIGKYRANHYDDINGFLRTGKELQTLGRLESLSSEELASTIKDIDGAFKRALVSEDVVAYRGASLKTEDFFGGRFDQNLKGFMWREDAYVSTSTMKREAERFARTGMFQEAAGQRSVLMRIVVPKGSRGIQLSGVNAEAELLLDRKYEFRVVADNGFDEFGRRLLDVEIVR
jgi:ADP-ribosyltransferase exoenzyme